MTYGNHSDLVEEQSAEAVDKRGKNIKLGGSVKEEKNPKVTAFTLLEDFCKTVSCVYIDGALHLFERNSECYRPVTQKCLEDFLLAKYYAEASQSGSLRIIKTCAELIMRYTFPQVLSAEKQMILCLQNGYIPLSDMENAVFCPYNYAQYNPFPTYQIQAPGLPTMTDWGAAKYLPTPWMDAFLRSSACGIPKFEERIWEMLGYLISPDQNGKCFFVLQGLPNSGKSLLGKFLQELFPEYKIATLDIDQLSKRNATSQLMNKSLNISMDLPNKALSPLAIRNIKLITGGDTITVEHQNGSYETYQGNCKFLFATNHALTLRGSDSGLEERIVCVPFTYSIPPQQRNLNLLNCLLSERNSMIAKALAYYRDLRNNGYVFSGSEYELFKPRIRYLPTEADDTDASLCEFVESQCEFVSQENGIYTQDLYNAYRRFCKDCNETPIDNENSFSRHLLHCYSDRVRKDKWRKPGESPKWGFKGILLQPIEEVKIDKV